MVLDAESLNRCDGKVEACVEFAYLQRAIQAVSLRRVPHDGNHRFVLRFGTARQRRRIQLGDGFEPRPYPKKPDPIPIYQ